MDNKRNSDEMPSIYIAAILGAEEILKKIQYSKLKEKLLLKNDDFLTEEKYHNLLVERMEFFIPEEGMEEIMKELQQLLQIRQKGRRDARPGRALQFSLEMKQKPYRIPMEIRLIPYTGHKVYPRQIRGTGRLDQEPFTYYKFPSEEYLALGFYEILNGLEFVKDMSWYKDIYEIIRRESLQGRKIWDSFERLISEHPIPSLEKRLDTVKSYKDYGYMKKRWKSQSRRKREYYPQWEQVVVLLGTFFTPIFDSIINNEIFLGDWMPQLKRFLD